MKCSADGTISAPSRAWKEGAMNSCLDGVLVLLLCRVEQVWRKTAAEIRKGQQPLFGGLQKFLRECANMFSLSGAIDVGPGLIHVLRGKLPPEPQPLTDTHWGCLALLDSRLRELAAGAQKKRGPVVEDLRNFVELVGRYVGCYIRGTSRVEQHRAFVEEFWRNRGFDGIVVPLLPIDDADLALCFGAKRNLLYRPSEDEAPIERLKLVLPNDVLEGTSGIIWQPAKQGYWYLVDGGESCPRVGEASYRDFFGMQSDDEEGEKLVDPVEYLIFWYFGECDGMIPDLDTGTMLRVRPGGQAIFAKGNLGDVGNPDAPLCAHVEFGRVEESLTEPIPDKGVRFRRIIT